jgi:hypothetical protein
MKEQKVLVVSDGSYASNIENNIDEILKQGYLIISVTAQHVSTASTASITGGYIIVFEKGY